MCTYLHKANGTYYFRMAIPAELRPHFEGRREIKHSLRTKDREKAKSLIPDHTKAAQNLLARARERADPVSASPPQPSASPARAARLRALEDYDRQQAELSEIDAREMAEREWAEEDRAPLAAKIAERLADPLAELSAEEAAVKDLLIAAQFEADIARQQLAFAKTRAYSPVVISTPDVCETDTDVAPAELLEPDIFERWKLEGSKRAKSVGMVGKSAEWFQARVGRIPVRDLTKSHIIAFKDKLIAEGQSVANINVRLSHISALLGWAARNGIVPTNVAKGTAIPNPQAKRNRRKPFELPELRAIFGGPVHAKGDRPRSGKGEAAYWLPVLALYTGARVRELAQLRRGDVRQISYPDAEGIIQTHWFLIITEEGDERGLVNALKNATSERKVPIHPALIELGFVRYVEGLEDQGGRIFPHLTEDKYGNPAAKWGEWFSSYLRNVCGVSDRRMTFHSFRHTFKDYARNARIEESLQRQIMGHEGGDVADNYGAGFGLHVLVAAMETYRVPGLEIAHP